jgi:hypothetical protein
MSLLTPAGGLVYHLRAARYSELWAPFRAELRRFLEQSLPHRGQLLLIGPSAGHCLPYDWLRGFERLTLIEPDALARHWLAARVRGPRIEQEARDLLMAPLLGEGPGLDAVLARRPDAAILFCNVLGQVHFSLSQDEHVRFQEQFRARVVPRLGGRPWASFHDRWSLDHAAVSRLPTLCFDSQPSDAELGERYFGRDGPSVTVLDHGTSELFPAALPRRYLSWQLTPRALHLVEAVAGANPRL